MIPVLVIVLSAHHAAAMKQQQQDADMLPPAVISSSNFRRSTYPIGQGFTGFAPLPDKAGAGCASEALVGPRSCSFYKNDSWLTNTVPEWHASTDVTIPFMSGLSAVRILGGIAIHNSENDTYTPIPEWDLVHRDSLNSSKLVYNWTRADMTLDGFRTAGVEEFLIVLDNVPYAFVAEEHRYYCGFGLASAPDDVHEYTMFIGDFVDHLILRYGKDTVQNWRFRLGTEADGPRLGPPWQSEPYPANNGRGGTFNLTNGLETYVELYISVMSEIKRRLPAAAVGPSNMAGMDIDNCSVCPFMVEFGRRIRNASVPIDFAAVSEYSRWDNRGNAPAEIMQNAVEAMSNMAKLASPDTIPLEVHEFGWAGWGQWRDNIDWTMGAFGSSWSVAARLWLRNAGVRRVFHWQYAFDYGIAKVNRTGSGSNPTHDIGYPIISGWGWYMAMINRMVGSSAVESSNATVEELVYQLPVSSSPGYVAHNDTIGCIKVQRDDMKELHLLLISSSSLYDDRRNRSYEISIDAASLRGIGNDNSCPSVTETKYDHSTSAHNIIKERLVQADMATDSDINKVPMIGLKMATDSGLHWLGEHEGEYMEISKSALQPKQFSGKIHCSPDTYVLQGDCVASSMTLLTLNYGTKI